MVYQHEIEKKEGFKWCTIFNLFKLLKLFQNYNLFISVTIWYVTTLLNLGFTCGNMHVQHPKHNDKNVAQFRKKIRPHMSLMFQNCFNIFLMHFIVLYGVMYLNH